MYNGVGLPTARGTGTSAHVQRNTASLRRPRSYTPHATSSRGLARQRRTTAAARAHERRRAIEVSVAQLEERLTAEGIPKDEIVKQASELRARLLSELELSPSPQDELVHKPEVSDDRAKLRDDALRRVLRVPANYEEGDSFRRIKNKAGDTEPAPAPATAPSENEKVAESEVVPKPEPAQAQNSDSESSSELSESSGLDSKGNPLPVPAAPPPNAVGTVKKIEEDPPPEKPSLASRRKGIPNPAAEWVRNLDNPLPPPSPAPDPDPDPPPQPPSPPRIVNHDRVRQSLEEVRRRRSGLPPREPATLHRAPGSNRRLDTGPKHVDRSFEGDEKLQSARIMEELEEVRRRRAGIQPAHAPPRHPRSRFQDHSQVREALLLESDRTTRNRSRRSRSPSPDPHPRNTSGRAESPATLRRRVEESLREARRNQSRSASGRKQSRSPSPARRRSRHRHRSRSRSRRRTKSRSPSRHRRRRATRRNRSLSRPRSPTDSRSPSSSTYNSRSPSPSPRRSRFESRSRRRNSTPPRRKRNRSRSRSSRSSSSSSADRHGRKMSPERQRRELEYRMRRLRRRNERSRSSSSERSISPQPHQQPEQRKRKSRFRDKSPERSSSPPTKKRA